MRIVLLTLAFVILQPRPQAFIHKATHKPIAFYLPDEEAIRIPSNVPETLTLCLGDDCRMLKDWRKAR